MRKKWVGIRVIASMCAALGWWGLLYPELTLTPDTVKVSVEDKEGNCNTVPQEWDFDSSLYLDLLNAGEGQIRIRSRLLTDFCSFWEALHDRDGDK